MVRPTLEYSNSVWGPSFILDQRKLEKVQHRATHLIPTILICHFLLLFFFFQLSSTCQLVLGVVERADHLAREKKILIYMPYTLKDYPHYNCHPWHIGD